MTKAEVRKAIADYLYHRNPANKFLELMAMQISWDIDQQIIKDVLKAQKRPKNEQS